MSDFPCRECGVEGRGPFAHTSRCSRQEFKMPPQVCPDCKGIYLLRGLEVCEECLTDGCDGRPCTCDDNEGLGYDDELPMTIFHAMMAEQMCAAEDAYAE